MAQSLGTSPCTGGSISCYFDMSGFLLDPTDGFLLSLLFAGCQSAVRYKCLEYQSCTANAEVITRSEYNCSVKNVARDDMILRYFRESEQASHVTFPGH